MRFFDRLSLMIKADAHGVMDSLEERSLLLKQHLREAELALAHKRAQFEALEEQRAQLGQEAERVRAQGRALDEDVELALAAQKDELARFAVRQLIPLRRRLAALESRIEEVNARREELAETLPEQERELDALRSRVKVELCAAERRDVACDFAVPGVAEEEIELELLRRRQASAGGAA